MTSFKLREAELRHRSHIADRAAWDITSAGLSADLLTASYRFTVGGEVNWGNGFTIATSLAGPVVKVVGKVVEPVITWGRKYVSKPASAAAETVPAFRNLAPLDEIVPARLFPAQQIQRVNYTGKLEYVVLESGELVLGRSGHISLSQGADVLAAGEARFFRGVVKRIDNMSGHYRPVGDYARNAAEAAFNRSGFDATGRYVERKFP